MKLLRWQDCQTKTDNATSSVMANQIRYMNINSTVYLTNDKMMWYKILSYSVITLCTVFWCKLSNPWIYYSNSLFWFIYCLTCTWSNTPPSIQSLTGFCFILALFLVWTTSPVAEQSRPSLSSGNSGSSSNSSGRGASSNSNNDIRSGFSSRIIVDGRIISRC